MPEQPLQSLQQLDPQIFRTIAAHPNLQLLENIEFHTTEDHIRLNGRVNSYFEKQMAQETIRSIDKGRHIENQLAVDW